MSKMDPKEIQLYYHPKDRLRMTCGDRSWHTVIPVWASPLGHPGKFLSLMDAKQQEITLIPRPEDLPRESWEAVQEELHRRYLTGKVERVLDAKGEWGATYWRVLTDRGEREFVTQNLQENAQWLGQGHILLTDVDGNKFEIKGLDQMDTTSKEIVGRVL